MNSVALAVRTLLKAPAFTSVAFVTLALGIGVNTSMYTLMDVLLFRAAPFPEPDRLVTIRGTSPQSRSDNFSFVEIEEMRDLAARSAAGGTKAPLESLTSLGWVGDALSEPGRPAEQLTAIDATADLFTTFRVQPYLGRPFTAEEGVPGPNRVALLSFELWQSRFGADPAVIGRTLRLNAEAVSVIGVMPAGFGYPMLFGKVDLWRPITMARSLVDDRNFRYFQAIGRLGPGVSHVQLEARLTPLAARWAQDYPKDSAGRGFDVMELHKSTMDSAGVMIVWLLMGLAGSVLLIACANLANLQLARATARGKDLAIRSALGASRTRLIFHQLTECMVLAVGGGMGGLLVATLVNSALGRAIRIGDAGSLPLPIDGRILAASFLVSVVAGIAFGLLPAWLASRNDVVTTLKQQSRGSTSGRGQRLARQGLIVAEVALALALLAVAGVMIRGFEAMLRKDAGWDTGRVLTANIGLPEQSTYDTEDKRRVAIDKLERSLAQIPGAEQTAICSTPPLFGYSRTGPIQVEGQTPEDPLHQPTAGYFMVGSGFFATLGIPLREGRLFPPDLRADHPPLVVIGESLARRFWPHESAIGKRIGDRDKGKVVWREVIGVVRDISFPLNLANPDTVLQVYKPLVQEPWGYLFVLVRGPAPASFKEQVRRAVADLDRDVAVQQMYTVAEASHQYQHNLMVINNTLGGFALLGLVLAAVGLYGVISNLVANRTAEFGIRLALGARQADVLALVLGSGVKLTLAGLVVGAGLAYALIRLLGTEMPRMAAADPTTLALVVVVLSVVALFACYWPARRATRVDPVEALRAE
jgi:putative ABC transport system permease protein